MNKLGFAGLRPIKIIAVTEKILENKGKKKSLEVSA